MTPSLQSQVYEEKPMGETEHIDEVSKAVKETAESVVYDAEEEKKAVRKLDLFLITMLWSMNIGSFLDRSNIGNAYAAGMGKALHITSDKYSWLLIIFFIAYICFHWTILVWKVVSPPILVMCVGLGWAGVSMLQAATTNYAGMLTCRFFLGAFEAAYAPGVPLFLSFFYNRREMGLRYGIFLSSVALASCFASAMAYGILQIKSSIAGWKLLFLIEGSPTVLLALIAGYVLPSAPNKCRFLTPRENEIVSSRAIKARGVEEERKLNFKQVFAAFYDYKNYLTAVVLFLLNSSYNCLPAFFPTIIQDIGIGDRLTSQGYAAPPFLFAFVTCITMTTISDRVGKRGIFISLLCCVAAVGFLLLSLVDTPGVRYFAVFLVTGGGLPAIALSFTWVTDNQGPASKRGAGLIIFGVFGQCGSVNGAFLFPKSQAPKYVKSMALCCGFLFLAAIVTQILSFCLRRQNQEKDRKYGIVDVKAMPAEIMDAGDQHPSYRYIV